MAHVALSVTEKLKKYVCRYLYPKHHLRVPNIISICSEHLERYRIVLPGRISQHNTGGIIMVPVKAKIPKTARALNQPGTLTVTPSRFVLG